MHSLRNNYGASFEVFVFFVGEGSLFGSDPLVSQLLDLGLTHLGFNGLEGKGFNEVKIRVTSQSSEDPEEGFFVLVVGLGGDVEILQVALPVEGDLAGLNFPVFLVYFVADKNDGDVVADPCEVFVPFGDIFVGDPGGDIEHEDGCIGSDVVAFPQSSQLFLTCGVPEGESDGSVVGVEGDGADFYSLGGDVLLLELSSYVSLDEGSLAYSSVSDEDYLELSNNFGRLHINYESLMLRLLLISPKSSNKNQLIPIYPHSRLPPNKVNSLQS